MSRYKRYKGDKLLQEFIEFGFIFIVSLFTALFIISNIASMTLIKERSMEPTFAENDRVIVYKLGYLLDKPAHGDVVILNRVQNDYGVIANMKNETKNIIDNIKYRFTGNIEKNNLIKRVIGLPGDIIDLKDGVLFINNIPQKEHYAQGSTYKGQEFEYPIEVPEGKYFVLGDNREYSLDSRDLGFIDNGQIKGKAIYTIYPFIKLGKIN